MPLRGGRLHAPNSVFVRARFDEETLVAEARSCVAFFAAVCDRARTVHGADSRWWTQPVTFRVAEIATDSLLPLSESEAALASLRDARLLVDAERGFLVDADVLSECPALASFDFAEASNCLRTEERLGGPAIATLRELVRLADADGALVTTLPHLLDSVLYGRTRLTQALSLLERVGILSRKDAPNRMVHFRLRSARTLHAPEMGSGPAAATPGPVARGQRMRLPTNAPLQVGGQTLELVPGLVPELEVGADGCFYIWLGPVRLGPYDP